MKLYLKINTLKILKNIDILLPKYNTKVEKYLTPNSPIEYITNLKSANILLAHKEKIFYDTRELKHLIKGVYFGNSSCEHLLPNITDTIKAYKICREKKYNFIFVVPPLSEFSFKCVDEIFEYLNNISCEVVVNDFGILQLATKYTQLKIILGTNFTKTIKKSFLNHDSKQTHHIEFENKEVRQFYKNLDISRISFENLPIETSFLKEAPFVYVDYYYPYTYISHSKSCQIASNFDNINGSFVNEECSKYCLSVSCDFKNSNIHNFYQRYNTIYQPKLELNLDKTIYSHKKNRLIWEIFL
jgi:hypothetical protein